MGSKVELLRKIKELSEKGIDGEKKVAEDLLNKLMKKYGVRDEKLVSEEIICHYFRYRTKLQKKLLAQIIYMVTGDRCLYKLKGKKKIGAYCTNSQRIEIEINFEFYKSAMEKDLEIFHIAFINKNNLFPKAEKETEILEQDIYKTETAIKVLEMMGAMEKHNLNKMIEGW